MRTKISLLNPADVLVGVKEFQERGKRSVKKMLSLQKRMERSYGEKVMPL